MANTSFAPMIGLTKGDLRSELVTFLKEVLHIEAGDFHAKLRLDFREELRLALRKASQGESRRSSAGTNANSVSDGVNVPIAWSSEKSATTLAGSDGHGYQDGFDVEVVNALPVSGWGSVPGCLDQEDKTVLPSATSPFLAKEINEFRPTTSRHSYCDGLNAPTKVQTLSRRSTKSFASRKPARLSEILQKQSSQSFDGSNSGKALSMECTCGNIFMPDAQFCRKCGRKREGAWDFADTDFDKAVRVGVLRHEANMPGRGLSFNKRMAAKLMQGSDETASITSEDFGMLVPCHSTSFPLFPKGGRRLAMLLTHPAFDLVVAALIMLNGFVIGLETELMASQVTEEVSPVFRVIEVAFCILFSCELALRIACFGKQFFLNEEWRWNLFDLAIVLLQVVEEIVTFIATTAGSTADAMSTNFSFMRLMRILRLIRIVRMVRVLRLISELRTMVTSIGSSMNQLLWAVVLLLLIIYVVSVYFTQLVVDHRITNEGGDFPELIAYWNSLGRSALTLFGAISGGIDWDMAIGPLMTHISLAMGPIFCLYIAFAVLALMNVVTGVFVENAIESANRDKERYLIETARDLFHTALSSTGVISWVEFEKQLESPELQGYLQGLGVDAASARGLFEILDVDGSGTIDAEELLTGTLRLRGGAKAIDLAALIYENRRNAHKTLSYHREMEASFKILAEYLETVLQSDPKFSNSKISQDLKILKGEPQSDSDPPSKSNSMSSTAIPP